MAHQSKLAWLIMLNLVLGTSVVFSQGNDDPFKTKDAVSAIKPIEINNPTMRQCLRLLQTGTKIAALRGKQAGIENKIQIVAVEGDTNALAAVQRRVEELKLEIVREEKAFRKALNSVKFDTEGRAEFHANMKSLQEQEITRNRDMELLKLKIRALEKENENLREQLAAADNER